MSLRESPKRLSVQIGLCREHASPDDIRDYCASVGATPHQVPAAGVAAALADGVAGGSGGRVAAELSVRVFLDAHLGLDPMRGANRNAVASLVAMNGWLHAQGRSDPALERLACTFSAIILRGRLAHVVHVGGNRLYRLRDGVLTRLTTDHVHARGAIGNVLTRALGAEADIRVDVTVESTQEHDRYLLCSDGVHAAFADRAIAKELRRPAGPQETAERLVRAVLAGRTGASATALLIDVVGLPDANQFDLAAALTVLPILPVPRSGTTVDGYRLSAMLSDGRYSRVFSAVDGTDGRAVVLKFPKPVIGAEPMLRQAFLREAWIAARLDSPYVAEVIEDASSRRGSLFTVMPHYDGETLERRLLRAPPVSLREGLAIADKLAKGVAALHRARVIHRDIKPDNVLLCADGRLKLLDLGVARLPHMEDVPATDSPGTPSYMAPELLAGAQGDERSDQYALGVTLYRMFARHYPYGEVEPFAKPRFARAPDPLRSHRPDLPIWLDQVLQRAVAARPEQRHADVVEFMFALDHGALRGAASRPLRRPLLDRDPLRFWQIVAAMLSVALLLALMRR